MNEPSNMSESPGHIILTDSRGTTTLNLPDVSDGVVGFETKGVLDETMTVQRAPTRPEQVWVLIQEGVTARVWFGEPPLTPLKGVDLLTTKVKLIRKTEEVGFIESNTEDMRSVLESTWVGSTEVFHITPDATTDNGYLDVVYAKWNPTLVVEHKGASMIVVADVEDHLVLSCVKGENNLAQDEELFKHVDDCSICLEQYDEEHLAVRLHCGHYFGEACILRVIERLSDTQPRCPNCRAWIHGA
ncbi:uncharacterized protein BDZ99DRAFT_528417 [Mytilinidion resinicola]|uniref:RING-type domain-containing protein n=1 Tax=Mytilinidion resinicola TaxID=574789 RepID=A0A6A6XY35_9PEZI|nr:uncharacterized protein BDZ99DRAFT_528417 [Mytilinidion resinicola]KAF2801466.1 hypothetical protein BDZ99DRAFT_528417 [Mytilinidion resinicola]